MVMGRLIMLIIVLIGCICLAIAFCTTIVHLFGAAKDKLKKQEVIKNDEYELMEKSEKPPLKEKISNNIGIFFGILILIMLLFYSCSDN